MSDGLLGGLSETKPADGKIQEICDKIKSAAEDKAGKTFEVFVAHSYRSQVVKGSNYYVKVHVGGDKYVHIVIWENLQCHGGECVFVEFNLHKKLDDPIL